MTERALKDSCEMLFTLLHEIGCGRDLIDTSELSGNDKLFLLSSCCGELVLACIRTMARNQADRQVGLEAFIDSLRKNLNRSEEQLG